jgi:uncharacterized membrane protein YphA (DoxX/SURF4 family)
MLGLSVTHLAELALALILLVAGIWFYRRPATDGQPGGQGAVLLFVVAALLAIHGLGLMNYHPSAYEIEASKR